MLPTFSLVSIELGLGILWELNHTPTVANSQIAALLFKHCAIISYCAALVGCGLLQPLQQSKIAVDCLLCYHSSVHGDCYCFNNVLTPVEYRLLRFYIVRQIAVLLCSFYMLTLLAEQRSTDIQR
uniref:Uncharacterized protein n=1 Tax=Glossina austeni TaxID=7395 RepID=A0A1A9ULU7_GLOAU